MKKTILSILALAALTLGLNAAPVDHETTRTVAANFWNTYRPMDVKAVMPDDLTLMTYDGLTYLDVFTFGGQGFIIMPTDDRVNPVLAYSFDSPFPEELHPSVRYWLDGYNTQLIEIVERDLPLPTDEAWERLLTTTPPATPKLLTNIPAMLTTRWNQSEPYNRQCPYDSNYHTRAVVGCVATAMAQVMKYWNHPSCGTDSHSYFHDSNYGTLSANFANTTYIWEYMPNFISFANRSYEINAVAKLSYHCGVAVEMSYSPEGSGAYTINYGNPNMPSSENALKDYFRYDRSLHGEQRYYYNDSIWRNMIDTDIVAGQPILYTGHDQSGGHAFVLDGADTNGRYHFNMGWGGYGDGFYTIDNIAPGGGGAGGNSTYTFNLGQTAIFGVKPIPQYFDTIDIYDTLCPSDAYYYFYDYSLPAIEGVQTAVHLETVYNIHLSMGKTRFAYLDPNGGEGITHTESFCNVRGLILPECTFTRNGWVFDGWCLSPDGEGTIYSPSDTMHIRTNKFIYAIWKHPGTAGIEATVEDVINVWPKIAGESLNLSLSNDAEASVTIVDTYGRVVIERRTVGGKAKISLEGLPAGTYTVLVLTAEGRYNTRIIKL